MRVFNLAGLAHMGKPGQSPWKLLVPSLTWDRASSLQLHRAHDHALFTAGLPWPRMLCCYIDKCGIKTARGCCPALSTRSSEIRSTVIWKSDRTGIESGR